MGLLSFLFAAWFAFHALGARLSAFADAFGHSILAAHAIAN